MGLWRKRQGKSEPHEDAAVASAREHIAQGDVSAAVRSLQAAAPSTEGDLSRLALHWLTLAEAVTEAGQPVEARTVAKAASKPTDTETVRNLVVFLRNHRLFRMAVPALRHLVSLDPSASHVAALMETYEDLADYTAARAVLETFHPNYLDDVDHTYFHVFYSIMSGDLSAAEQDEPRLLEALVGDGPDSGVGLQRVHRMLMRAQTARSVTPLDDWDLRGWHYVITGAVLLHLSPYGWEDTRGRGVYVGDDYARCRDGLVRLGQVLERWNMPKVPVLDIGEPQSSAMALAAGELFDLEVVPYREKCPGIATVYDLDQLEDHLYQDLSYHRPNQVLYAHTSRWTDSSSGYAADITGHLHQANTPPWGQKLRMRSQGGAEKIPPHPGPPSVWASYILAGASPPDPDAPHFEIPPDRLTETVPPDFPPDEDIIDNPEPLWGLVDAVSGEAAAFRTEGRRSRFWAGGPVPSSHFL